MSSNTITVGELLYDMTVNFTKVTEYGVSMNALAGGRPRHQPERALMSRSRGSRGDRS